jgi:hypothetical protein
VRSQPFEQFLIAAQMSQPKDERFRQAVLFRFDGCDVSLVTAFQPHRPVR